MTFIDGETNHLLNVLNSVLYQSGEDAGTLDIIYRYKDSKMHMEFNTLEELREFLDTGADDMAREEAKRRTGSSGYEQMADREYDRIMERANK